jgi:hypothetical protein
MSTRQGNNTNEDEEQCCEISQDSSLEPRPGATSGLLSKREPASPDQAPSKTRVFLQLETGMHLSDAKFEAQVAAVIGD